MLAKIFDSLFGDKSFTFEQRQREAALRLLMMVMHADGKVADEEMEQLCEAVSVLGWDADQDVHAFLLQTSEEIGEVHSDQAALEAEIKSTVGDLHSDYLVKKLYKLCEDMAHADAHVDRAETRILRAVRVHLPED